MKRIHRILIVAVLALFPAKGALAQVPVEEAPNLVNNYIDNAAETRSSAWWNALGRQLTLSLDKPVEQIRGGALQNVIFFTSVHGDKVKLNDAAPKLLEIYEKHPDEQIRIMAVAALHAIGDADGMRTLYVSLESEPSERVKKVVTAAVNDFYRGRTLWLTLADRD